MATIIYVTDARLPTEKAHGLQIMKTCEALAAAGNELTLLAPRRRNDITRDPFDYYEIATRFPLRKLFSIDLVRFGRVGFLIQECSFALSAALAIPASGYDAVYGRDEIVLAILSLCGARHIIWESHDGAWNYFARLVARRSKRMVVVSNGLRDFYIGHGVPSEKISVIPNAIDAEEFSNPESKSESRARLGLPADAKIAMYIGRLDGWKGTDTLIEASQMLRDIKVAVIGGAASQAEELRTKYPDVIFLGYRPYSELPDNQSAADVLVVPNTGKSEISTRFTSPLKLIAHLSSGRPIVASDLPSIREIGGSDAALLVPADDPQALADAIRKVIADPEFGDALSRNARTRSSAYTWAARAEAIGNLL